MIGQILGSLGGLAKSYIDAKTTVKITEGEIKREAAVLSCVDVYGPRLFATP